jgi:hypothetical protein
MFMSVKFGKFKLGKLPARIDPRTFQLKKLLVKKNLPPLPATYDVDSEFINFSDRNMFGNDKYGDCVMAGRAHMTLRFEDFEQKQLIKITDKDVEDEYFKETGGQDSGLVMLDSLNEWRKTGWTAASKPYTIYAYAQIDVANHNELKYSVLLLRGAYTGFQVPQSAMDQFNAGQPWTVSGDNTIIGGHCVYIKAYNEIGPICVTWGAEQQMTWEFWNIYFDEAYGVIDAQDTWLDPSTDPLNCEELAQKLNEITNTPAPPTPPPPPPPTPSPCKVGGTVAKIANLIPWLLHRNGRFFYMNPPKNGDTSLGQKIKQKILDYFPLILIGSGLMMQIFTVWQFDIMLVNRMWGSLQGNLDFFSLLIKQGFTAWSQAPFTINAELFPNMTFGVAYDLLMAMNIMSWFLTVTGAYSLNKRYKKLKKIMKDNGFDKPLFPNRNV